MKRYDNDFLEKTDVKNIIEYIKTNGLDNLSSFDISRISDDDVKVFFDNMLEFATDYTKKENAENYSRGRTEQFKKRYDKFLMCYDVLLKNDLVTPELKKLKEYYDRIMLNKVRKLIEELKSLNEDQTLEKEAKLEALERIMESLKLSEGIVMSDEHKPLFKVSKAEFEKIKLGAIKQKEDDDKKLDAAAVTLEQDEPKKDDSKLQGSNSGVVTGAISNSSTKSTPEKKSILDKRLESLKLQLIPETEIQRLKEEVEALFESISKASKDGNNPKLVNELYAKYKETKADLELALDNNEKLNKKIARLEGTKKIASIPRKEFNKLKEKAKLKSSNVKKQIHKKMDPIVDAAKETINDAKEFVVDKATDVKDFVVDKATEAKEFVVDKATEAKDFAVDKVVTAYNDVGKKIQNKVDEYSPSVKSEEQISGDAISEALSSMGTDVSIAQIDDAVAKISKEAAKESKKAERKVALFGSLQKLHSIPKSLKDAIKNKASSLKEQQVSTGRTI